jgi:hypothetical protein
MIFPAARTEEQKAITQSIAAFGSAQRREQATSVIAFSTAGWQRLAALGIVEHACAGGAASDLVAASEAVAAEGMIVPLAEALAAARILRGDEAGRLAAGDLVAVIAAPGCVRWGAVADVAITFGAGGEARAGAWTRDAGDPEPGSLLCRQAGTISEPSSAVAGAHAHALALAVFAATLVGFVEPMIRAAADYARDRRQFGRSIGSFQAVGHPLAECHAQVRAARDLAMAVAVRLDREPDVGDRAVIRYGEMAVSAARSAALRCTYVTQHVLGGMGYVVEGPMGAGPLAVRDLCLGEAVHAGHATEGKA